MIAGPSDLNAIDICLKAYLVLQSAALTMDDTILDVDQVENLIKFCPTKEEMELLKVKTKFLVYVVLVFF
jgi:hypothetical protein